MRRDAAALRARMFAPIPKRPVAQKPVVVEPVEIAEEAPAPKAWAKPQVGEAGFIPPKPAVPEQFQKFTVHPIRRLTSIVAKATGVSFTDLRSPRRMGEVSKARQILFFVARVHTSFSLPEIARRVGGKNHTSVLHGVRKVQAIVDRLNIKLPDDPAEMVEVLWTLDWSEGTK
jgi:hypothetical protein